MLQNIIVRIKTDCRLAGYGRKKWWADQLHVPPLTVSHWLAGRQKPSGEHALKIVQFLETLRLATAGARWKNLLWNAYYDREALPNSFLPEIASTILSQSTVDSRTLGLLSLILEHREVPFSKAESPTLRNRLGWLIETAGKDTGFHPVKNLKTQTLLEAASKSAGLKQYMARFQTEIGKKWRIYDCSLDEIKKSLPWPRNWNES